VKTACKGGSYFNGMRSGIYMRMMRCGKCGARNTRKGFYESMPGLLYQDQERAGDLYNSKIRKY
jgi:hypothetical protein